MSINPYVVAFPRSGTHFLRRAIGYAQGLTGDALEKFYIRGYNDHQEHFLRDKSNPIVTILRRPEECIPSALTFGSMAAGKEFKNDMPNVNARQYISFYSVMLDNIDNIYPILFEQLRDSLDSTLGNLLQSINANSVNNDIDDFVKKYILIPSSESIKNVSNSSKNHESYQEMVDKYNQMDQTQLDLLNEKYLIFKDAILQRQSELGWKL